jgi:signal transduction histidine kinase
VTLLSIEDERRVAGIEAYGALDDVPRPELLAVVELAAAVCGVPMATINLITATEQHQVATRGFEASVCRRGDSMCALVLHDDAPVVVTDAALDPRFMTNPFVTGELGSVRFYAAHKLVTREGVAFGTLCVFDDVPRELNLVQTGALRTLADRVVDVFELQLGHRRLQESLLQVEEMRARLELSNDRLAAFAGQVTHDLKTPLTTMSLSLELIRDELEDGADTEDVLPLISRALAGSVRMTSMIEDVLDFARLGTSIDPEPVDLATITAEVVTDLASALYDVDLTIGDLPVVSGDSAQLRSLVQNLLSNAAKFRSADRAPVVTVTSRRLAGRWRIEVADNGIGVPADQRDRVFEPMVRLDKRIDGVGIGLATCRRIVDAHGGAIGVSAPPSGPGAVLWVELPGSEPARSLISNEG